MFRICFDDGTSIHSEISKRNLLYELNNTSDNFIVLVNAKTDREEIINKNKIKYIRISNRRKEEL